MTEWADKPSVFTPFARRFTDEHARDVAELRALYEEVRTGHAASEFTNEAACISIGSAIYAELPELGHLSRPFVRAIDKCLRMEKAIFALLPAIDWTDTPLSLKEHVDLSRFLRAKQYFLAHQERAANGLVNGLTRIFASTAEAIPKASAASLFTIPLVHTLSDPKGFVDKIAGTLQQDQYADLGLFADLRDQLYRNMCDVSGIIPYTERKKPWKYAPDSDLSLEGVVRAYLKGTPFLDLFLTPVPLQFRQEDRFSHMHIVGGSGAGKTTLLQNLILHDLESDDPPSLVIVDSQGDLISKLSRLRLFEPGTILSERLLIVSPKDIHFPPALNIFDVNRSRLGRYDEATKEQVTAGVIQTFDYLFSGLFGADLTAKQGVLFRFVARLMLALPETMGRPATILDLIALMDDPAPYKMAIVSLPPIQRQFFERDFASKTFAQTKEQIRYRLNAILENPTLARLFTSSRTKLDLFTCLNEGGVVLVDTAKDFLKGSSASFGRIFISLVMQAILERAAIPPDERRPTFLIVDEAAAYFDSNIDDLLTEARKYRLGCVFAHQFLDQAASQLRASLAANTAIKMASGVSVGDARTLAPDMRTSADFILGQPRLHFAGYFRGATPSAVSIPVEVGLLEAQPKLSEASYEALLAQSRTRLALESEDAAAATGNQELGSAHSPNSDPTAPAEW